MIFGVQVKVREEHGDGPCNQQQHRKGQEEDAVERVDPWPPDGVEDVVELYVDRAEREEAGGKRLSPRALVPLARRDLPSQLVGLARERVLPLAQLDGPVPADNTPKNCQWERDAGPHRDNEHNRPEREGSCGAVRNGDRVEKRPNHQSWACERQSCGKDVPRPLLPTQLLVEVRASVATDRCSDHVGDHAGRGNSSTLVVDSDAAHKHYHDHHAEQLHACTNGGAEE
mmetsp:Transcript_16184/g.37922  ORF Transcript_16184/g.37922 Transcript_16184/m.37922 type:complete len:228 (+) Transcript_16184:384-1067(+)